MNRCLCRWMLLGVTALVASTWFCDSVSAQAGLRESLERLDRNQNGSIDPDEITPLSRPYLERVAAARRMSLERPNRIDQWQEAARIYYALQNGVAGERIRPEGENSVQPFGALPDEPLVPEFGLAEVKYPYIQADLYQADKTLRRNDRDEDGYITRAEAARGEWTHRNPFDDDLDGDDRLNRLELGQRYARRRLLQGMSDELVQKARRTGNGIRPSTPTQQSSRNSSDWWRRGGTEYYLTATILGRFDANKNGRLEASEVANLGIPIGRMDADRDGELSREELHALLADMQEQAGGLSDALPSWFFELDANRDEQVAMIEFTDEWTDEKILEFTSLDTNGDGLLTASEVLQSEAAVGGTYRNQEAEVLPPRKTVISEIEVSEDYLVGDLNVQLSITHTYASRLDGYLTGPDGQRVELFTEIGGSDDHFDQTTFDDQSRYPITKARPPFTGTFIPEGRLNNQPSLSHFNGKSVKGVWQLVIRCSRSERFGMLHGWSLIVKPQADMLEGVAVAPAQDGPQPSLRPPGPESVVDRSQATKTVYRGGLVINSGNQDVRSADVEARKLEARKQEARKQAIERYQEYFAKMKSEGREIPKEKAEYFKKALKEIEKGKEQGKGTGIRVK